MSGPVQVHHIRVTDGLAHASLLSADELTQAARFHFQVDRDRFTAGRGATRWLLGRALGAAPGELTFAEGTHGKPFVVGATNLHFNRSHSGDWVLIGLATDREVGIDVELVRADIDVLDLGRTVLTAGELAVLAALTGDERRAAFFRVWTRKEAVLKAWGVGLSLDPREVHVGADAEKSRVARGPNDSLPVLSVEDLWVDPGHAGAVAWTMLPR